MNDLSKEAGLPQPVFNTEGMFSVCFKRPGKASEKTVEKTAEKTADELIVSLMIANPKVTTKDMMKATGLSRRGVEYQLNKLKDSGRIERIGPDKGGYWQLTINNQ